MEEKELLKIMYESTSKVFGARNSSVDIEIAILILVPTILILIVFFNQIPPMYRLP